MVNIYVLHNNLNLFKQILKDFVKCDDYFIDGERLGKKRVVFSKLQNANQFVYDIFPHLPEDSMVVFTDNLRTEGCLLCVGEVETKDLSIFETLNGVPSIFTKKKNKVRVNIWVPYSRLDNLYTCPYIKKLSTIKGQIQKESLFKITFKTTCQKDLHQFISEYSDGFILKKNKLFVKLSLSFFCSNYEEIKKWILDIDILDKDSF